MSIIVVCPRCGAKLKAPDASAGRTFACPKCKETVTVPNSAHARPKSAISTPPPHLPSDARAQSNKEGFAPLAHTDSDLPFMVTDYISSHLMPKESLIAVSHIHPMVLLAPGIIAVFGFTLVGIAAYKESIFPRIYRGSDGPDCRDHSVRIFHRTLDDRIQLHG